MVWENIKLSLWGAVGGAIVLAIIGFKWGGWVTGGTARKMAEEMAAVAVVDRLTPICVASFNQDPKKNEKLKELKKEDSWAIGKYVEKQGWATMLGETKPDSKVADACAKQLAKTSQ
jgi:hypothetical protein